MEFMSKPNSAIARSIPLSSCVEPRKSRASTMFVRGPAIEVLPMVSLSGIPATITAPGEMILKGDMIDNIVIKAPNIVIRNSAHKP